MYIVELNYLFQHIKYDHIITYSFIIHNHKKYNWFPPANSDHQKVSRFDYKLHACHALSLSPNLLLSTTHKT